MRNRRASIVEQFSLCYVRHTTLCPRWRAWGATHHAIYNNFSREPPPLIRRDGEQPATGAWFELVVAKQNALRLLVAFAVSAELGTVFRAVMKQHNLAPGDFPDLEPFRSKLADTNFTRFPKLKPKMLEDLDEV